MPRHHREGRCLVGLRAQREAVKARTISFGRRPFKTLDGWPQDRLAYPDPARWGCQWHLCGQLARTMGIGLGNETQGLSYFRPTEVLYASVASGDVEIGFNQISEILAQPTVGTNRWPRCRSAIQKLHPVLPLASLPAAVRLMPQKSAGSRSLSSPARPRPFLKQKGFE